MQLWMVAWPCGVIWQGIHKNSQLMIWEVSQELVTKRVALKKDLLLRVLRIRTRNMQVLTGHTCSSRQDAIVNWETGWRLVGL